MTFLEPALLVALPLAALPVVIHLIHLYRRRQVKWAAMMFLRAAQRMNKGLSRLRQVAILALRVLAVAAILFVITRPLAGGWLGLTGGAPDTVLILLDRSASMEQQNTATGVGKRLAGLRNLSKAITEAVGTRSRLVLIDSALGKPQTVEKADALLDLPQAEPTETAADIPALLQAGLDYISANKTGRTDVWVLSDFQQTDWDAASGRWETLRAAYATMQGVRFHLLGYPQPAPDDLAIGIDRVARHETAEKAELMLDLRLSRNAENPQPMEVPLRLVVNGTATTMKVTLKENQLVLQGHAIPIDKSLRRGAGRVELPADSCSGNNVFHFVFDEPPAMRSVIVSDNAGEADPLNAALSASADPSRKYAATVLAPGRAAELPWEETALIVWQAPIPKPDEVLHRQLQNFVASGRTILFLPPESPDGSEIFGLRWEEWVPSDKPQLVEWWRNDADLLANTRDGTALPVGTLEISRRRRIGGEGIPLARVNERMPLLMRSASTQEGNAYFLGTLPNASSSLARDGVVMFALLHRALNEGARNLGKVRQRIASATALGEDPSRWRRLENAGEATIAANLPLRAGVVVSGDQMTALNRPPGEDQPRRLAAPAISELFAGLDFRLLTDNLEDGRSLTNEIWRTFLIGMALALLGEALLCLP
ncbi:MAG: BatA domain-containing protein, partial [Verrucomicrobiota bacterium]